MRAKYVNFERGQDPKSALDVGIIQLRKKITNDDLMLLGFGWDYNKQEFDPDEFKKEYVFRGDSERYRKEQLEFASKIALALKDQIIYNFKRFDWKEEDEMIKYIKLDPYPNYPYIYDAHVGIDDWQIIWSKIPLPEAQEIDINIL